MRFRSTECFSGRLIRVRLPPNSLATGNPTVLKMRQVTGMWRKFDRRPRSKELVAIFHGSEHFLRCPVVFPYNHVTELILTRAQALQITKSTQSARWP